MLTRRHLLATCSVIALFGCGAPTPPVPNPNPAPGPSGDLSVLIGDVTTLVSGLTDQLLPWLATIAGLSAATAAKIKGWIALAVTLANQVGAQLSIAGATPLVQQIVPIVLDIISAIAGVPGLPSAVSLIMSALSAVLPIILNLVGLTMPRAPRPFAGYVNLTPDQAWAVLHTGRL